MKWPMWFVVIGAAVALQGPDAVDSLSKFDDEITAMFNEIPLLVQVVVACVLCVVLLKPPATHSATEPPLETLASRRDVLAG
jgi:hypothetical protein